MVGIIVMTHGSLAEELVRSAAMLAGPLTGVRAVSLLPEDSVEHLIEKTAAAADELADCGQLLLMADLFGGTPANTAARWVAQKRAAMVAGVNLPMLLEAILQRENYTADELASQAAQWGRDGIRALTVQNLTSQ